MVKELIERYNVILNFYITLQLQIILYVSLTTIQLSKQKHTIAPLLNEKTYWEKLSGLSNVTAVLSGKTYMSSGSIVYTPSITLLPDATTWMYELASIYENRELQELFQGWYSKDLTISKGNVYSKQLPNHPNSCRGLTTVRLYTSHKQAEKLSISPEYQVRVLPHCSIQISIILNGMPVKQSKYTC